MRGVHNLLLLFLVINYTWMILPDLYIHRGLAHNQVKFSNILSKFVRLIFWSRSFKYKEENFKYWVATHLKHHATSDSKNDPQSPYFYTIKFLLTKGRARLTNKEVAKFTKNYHSEKTKLDDFFEKYQYGPYVFLIGCLIVFGYWGILCWISLMLTAYYSAIGNILFHTFPGYRNNTSLTADDRSRNILFPIGIIMGGEELHGNHHRWPGRANFAVRFWEFDIGYVVLKLLEKFKLVTILSKENKNIKGLESKLYV